MAADGHTQGARRLLFSSTAGSGHFHPMMPLAQALRAAGHAVAFAGPEAFRPAVGRPIPRPVAAPTVTFIYTA